jgi:PKD repeat protein
MGGEDVTLRNLYDTWESTDNGVTWSNVSTFLNVSGEAVRNGENHALAMPDDTIIVAGIADSPLTLNRTYISKNDGVFFTVAQANNSFIRTRVSPLVLLPNGLVVRVGGISSSTTLANTDQVYAFDPTGSTSQNPIHTYTADGTYKVVLKVRNSINSDIETKIAYITVGGGVSTPVASFNVDKTTIRFPNIITCTDTSTNTPTSWQWQWGDGTANSTTQHPTHQYTKRGTYSIDMTATNAGGSGSATAKTVKVIGYQDNFT